MIKVSLGTVCMNRLEHLKMTLPKNIDDNLHTEYVDFVLLDYNSQDGLQDWVFSNLSQHIKSGKLKYYKTTEPKYFNRSHSRNVLFRIADGDVVCNVDADNYTGRNFGAFIQESFTEKESTVLYCDGPPNCVGRVAIRKQDFHAVRGYDEAMSDYGYEDIDFIKRLVSTGLREKLISDTEFLQYISHTNEERIKNERLLKNIHSAFVHKINYCESEFVVLYADNQAETFFLVDTMNVKADDCQNIFVEAPLEFQFFFRNNELHRGVWNAGNDDLTLNTSGGQKHFKRSGQGFVSNGVVYTQLDKRALPQLVLFRSEINNRNKLIANARDNSVVNQSGFGRCCLYENLNQTPTYLE